jgi:NAD(P)-dependent dehydrogenase (short-subunit alcohol dehydrogenase family)
MTPIAPHRERLAAVTGASSGIGLAVAERLHEDGYVVLGGALDFPHPARRSGKRIEARLDVRRTDSVAAWFAHADELDLPLSVLVHCAGIGLFRSLEDTDDDAWDDVVTTNLGGSFRVCRAAIPRMRRAGGGRIFTIGSLADHKILPHGGAYGASKFGVRSLTGTINEEHKHDHIRATLVSPGAVATRLWGESPAFSPERMLQPADVAATISSIARMPLHVRVDAIEILPGEGVL